MSKKSKTKSELMREMQEHCDYVNNNCSYYEPSFALSIKDEGGIFFYMYRDNLVGRGRCYRPDPVPPKENELVWVRHYNPNGTIVLLSKGKLKDSCLLCKDEHTSAYDKGDTEGGWEDWCSVEDENNHSEGWDHSWIPRVKR